jgi:hypothetical protein
MSVASRKMTSYAKTDCVGASKGLFFGLLTLVSGLICLILFFVLIDHDNQQVGNLSDILVFWPAIILKLNKGGFWLVSIKVLKELYIFKRKQNIDTNIDRNIDRTIDTKLRQEHGQVVIILGMSENQITNDLYLKIKINVLYFIKI